MQSTFEGPERKKEITDDWTFADADTRRMTHGLHTYPARMIPQVTEKLITKFAKSDDLCIDPFCGSGTVLVEAKLKGIRSVGVDANPLAVLISKVKTTPIKKEVLEREWSSLRQKIEGDISKEKPVEVPTIKNLEYWFKPQAINGLAIIKHHINKIENKDVQDFFKVCFSVTVRKVSNIRSGEFKLYRLPPDKLKLHDPKPLLAFSEVTNNNIQRMDKFYKAVDKSVKSIVVKGDTRKLLELDPRNLYENCATLLITSPPYGDSHTTVAYGQFSRYSSAWLDFDEEEVWKVDRIALGGKLFDEVEDLESPALTHTLHMIADADEYRARETYAFFKDIDTCFAQIAKVMKKRKSTICFVLGNRTVKRMVVPADQIMIELGHKHGFKYYDTYHREIPSKTMPLQNAPENEVALKGETISKENIVVWKY